MIQVHSPPIEILTSRGANLTVGGLPFQQCAAHTFGRSLENPGTVGRAKEYRPSYTSQPLSVIYSAAGLTQWAGVLWSCSVDDLTWARTFEGGLRAGDA